ncbi:MAG: thiamine pyrophosphate-dependent dehydrogenase E1 component subunit alpha [Magnetococcales bacterium]|nr:thiamine pyrophosphate-dependent dehydrogenase E1 component subunit alpha [Magnetococcales bacterium]
MTQPMQSLPEMYHTMLRIRRVEEALAERYPDQEMRCPMHLCTGQEAVAAGVSIHLRQEDVVFSNHRAHGHYLAKGGSLDAMVAEIYGKSGGCCGGRGGSMHLVDLEAGFLGSAPIVAGTVPLAVGAAWASKLHDRDQVAVVYFGDGCFEEGVLHETMNFASLKQLPVVFVCENNGYSVYTPLAERQPDRPILEIARAHKLSVDEGDGNDVQDVAIRAGKAIQAAREQFKPQFLELHTYRWLEHVGPYEDDHLGYRPAGELKKWRKRCPIQRTAQVLTEEYGWSQADFDKREKWVAKEIEAAFQFSKESPPPDSITASQFVYAE